VAKFEHNSTLLFDQAYLTKTLFEELSENATEIGRLISGLMKYLSGPELRGSKYR